MLEPTALKGARWVLRGGGGGNASFLPDPYLTGGVYMNFLEGAESQQRIRDGLVQGGYARLAQTKKQTDPDNLLRYSFNIA
jgi:hypothetical protein